MPLPLANRRASARYVARGPSVCAYLASQARERRRERERAREREREIEIACQQSIATPHEVLTHDTM